MSDLLCKGSYFLGSACGSCSRCRDERNSILEGIAESNRLLQAAFNALRSYQYGNAATDLAQEIADDIDRFLRSGKRAQQQTVLDVRKMCPPGSEPLA